MVKVQIQKNTFGFPKGNRTFSHKEIVKMLFPALALNLGFSIRDMGKPGDSEGMGTLELRVRGRQTRGQPVQALPWQLRFVGPGRQPLGLWGW